MKTITSLYTQYREIISYLFWGVMATVVSWGTYTLFAILFKSQAGTFDIFGLHISVVVFLANTLSWLCAVLFAFFTNKMWVFRSRSWASNVWVPEFLKFVSARIITGVIEIISVPLLVSLGLNQTIMGVEGVVAKVLVSVIVVLLNYVFSKLFIFK